MTIFAFGRDEPKRLHHPRSAYVLPPCASAAPSRKRTSSACRCVPVFSKMFARWVLAVASEIPHRRAAALRPSPLRISAASAASMEVRSKRRRKFICRRRRSRSRSVTVTMATGPPKPIQGTSGSRVSDRSGATVTWSGDRGRSRGTLSSPPGPPISMDLRAQLDSLRRVHIDELQLPKLAIYAHSQAEVERNGFEETQLLAGQKIFA